MKLLGNHSTHTVADQSYLLERMVIQPACQGSGQIGQREGFSQCLACIAGRVPGKRAQASGRQNGLHRAECARTSADAVQQNQGLRVAHFLSFYMITSLLLRQ